MKNNDLANQVTKFLLTCDDKMLRILSVTSLARLFNVDRSHLAREFKASKKYTLCQFIQKEKMGRAVCLLILNSSSQLTVKRLSEKMGYCSPEYFREIFKKHFGVVPSKYREYKILLKKKSLDDRRKKSEKKRPRMVIDTVNL